MFKLEVQQRCYNCRAFHALKILRQERAQHEITEKKFLTQLKTNELTAKTCKIRYSHFVHCIVKNSLSLE